MKIITVVGARPQLIKASVVSSAFSKIPDTVEKIIHTGQHFDKNMSDVFFEELGIKKPDFHLNINSCAHGKMTGLMLAEIEKILTDEKPDYVVVYGDTNSTLAGSLAASKLDIPIAHIEAGLRSYNRKMPEEINRIVTDELSSLLFCPTETAVENLKEEGFDKKPGEIIFSGDVMFDSALYFREKSRAPSCINSNDKFALATCHRAENTNDKDKLVNIIEALNTVHKTICPIVMPIHPRTEKILSSFNIQTQFKTIPPVGFLEMLWLLERSSFVLTDSGGLQKEAYFFDKKCITLREETEWVELLHYADSILVGSDKSKIIDAAKNHRISNPNKKKALYGNGDSASLIARKIANSG